MTGILSSSRTRWIVAAVSIAVVVGGWSVLSGQTVDQSSYVRDHYTKQEYRIPMRDGVRLFTAIYMPKDTLEQYPILMRRTPYSCSPYGENRYHNMIGPSREIMLEGYIVVYQDVRGCYMSEGEFVNMTPHIPEKKGDRDVDESSDTYDTIEWLVNNIPNNNGRVGLWGVSYPGFYAAASMIDAHPALKASSPQAPIADWWYDDFHHHGAFFLPHAFRFLNVFGQERPEPTTQRHRSLFDYPTPDGYQFYMDMGPLKNANEEYFRDRIAFWNRIVEHPSYDSFWQARNILPHLKNVAPAVMTVGGWFDAEDLYGPLSIYRRVETENPGIFNILVMGPWAHAGWAFGSGESLGDIHFGSPASVFYRQNIEFPFFHYHLKGKGVLDLPEAFVFETGANQWRTFDVWPPAEAELRSLYFRENGRLDWTGPTAAGEVYDEYLSDPNKPVPHTPQIGPGMNRQYMTDDQRFASRRPDVLVYQTDVLEEDITLVGPVAADLWVSTSGTDSDWIVKLIDVYPGDAPDPEGLRPYTHMGGYQMMVRSEVIRGRFRKSHENPEPFVPYQPTKVRLPLQDVFHTFKRGHRIMVHVQSTWFPLVDRNPQKYVDNIFLAEEEDFIKAIQRVYRSRSQPTRLEVSVLLH